MTLIRRLTVGSVGLLMLGVVLSILGASAASADAVSCTGALGAVTINGDVSAGPGCDLSNTTVNGNVTVNPGGSLTIAPGSTTTITGNLESTDATSVLIQLQAQTATTYTGEKVTIGGNVDITRTTGTTAGIEPGNLHVVSVWVIARVGGNVTVDGTAYAEQSVHGTIKGNVEIQDGTGYAFVSNAIVGGNVQLEGNTGHNAPGTLGVIGVFNDHVHGNVVAEDNSLTATGAGSVNVVEVFVNLPSGSGGVPPPPGAAVDGNVIVQDNQATGASINQPEVFDNPVGGNILIQDNTATAPAGSRAENFVSTNTVGGNLNMQDNTATAPAGSLAINYVASNTISGNLNCHGNTPVATDDGPISSPSPNTAGKKTGECSAL